MLQTILAYILNTKCIGNPAFILCYRFSRISAIVLTRDHGIILKYVKRSWKLYTSIWTSIRKLREFLSLRSTYTNESRMSWYLGYQFQTSRKGQKRDRCRWEGIETGTTISPSIKNSYNTWTGYIWVCENLRMYCKLRQFTHQVAEPNMDTLASLGTWNDPIYMLST
jgi:hypothetical protein